MWGYNDPRFIFKDLGERFTPILDNESNLVLVNGAVRLTLAGTAVNPDLPSPIDVVMALGR